jgi:FAD/FMN-containing dehydrogenase
VVGGAISRFGALSDNVLGLRVVTGRGEQLTCSPILRGSVRSPLLRLPSDALC